MSLRVCLAVLIAMILMAIPTTDANAHALQPGYLEVSSVSDDGYRVIWRKPDVAGKPMAIQARLPDNCGITTPPPTEFDGRVWTSIWITACDGGLRGQEIVIDGLEDTRTDVLVRYELPGGDMRSERLTSSKTGFTIPADPSAWSVMHSYFPLGVEHILGGIDHLLFVFALLLLIRDRWRLLLAITAFTVAHSITMAAATLGWVNLPGPPVEAVIALSIMFLASEILRRGPDQERLSERYPWTVSFSFGLLHGFGFAGALAEIGIPETDIPLALLSFNIGVEVGQLLFVAAVLIIGLMVRRIAPRILVELRTPHSAFLILSAYCIGTMSAYWLVERVLGFFA